MKQSNSKGHIFVTTVLLLTLVSAMVGLTLTITGTTTKNTGRSRSYAEAQAAAEGALEYAYGIWMKRVNNRNDKITTNESNAGLTGTTGNIPSLNGFSNTKGEIQVRIDALDEFGVAIASGTSIPPGVIGRVPGYDGWSGQTFSYAAQATVKLDNGTTIGVRRLFQYTQVPLFQSMFFFEHDMEFYYPAEMIIKGLIHTNSTGYFFADSGNLKIQDYISYVTAFKDVPPSGKYYQNPPSITRNPSKDPDSNQYWPWFLSGTSWVKHGDTAYPNEFHKHVHQVARIEPMGSSPEQAFLDITNPNVSGEFHELIEPPVSSHTDPPAIADRRLINKAGIVINVNGTKLTQNATFTSTFDASKNATVFTSPQSSVVISVPAKNGATLSAAGAKAIANAITKTKGTEGYVTKSGSFAATGIYDAREKKRVDTLNMNLSSFKQVVEPTSGSAQLSSFNGVLYIHDTTVDVDNPTAKNPSTNTIRLTNGSVLPNTGLTVASENPVYVQGDYNTGGTGTSVKSNATGNPNNADHPTTVDSSGKPSYTPKPAAIIADAVMFLSNSWNDANSKNVPSASNTTYNMAILAGYMPSTSNSYSGGANNFPRYLENWSSKTCTYWGSMVELFPSKVFTGKWALTNVYSPPKRCWNFDTRFLTTPPPGSVDAIILTRGPWSRF